MAAVTIWHNPKCGTSRNTLALIRNAGIEPLIVDYLAEPPDRARLERAIRDAGLTVRQALRDKESRLAELGLSAELPDGPLLEAMTRHPILINRPFVFTALGSRGIT